MNYQQAIDWIRLNWIQSALIVVVIAFGIGRWIKKRKEKKLPPPPPPEKKEELKELKEEIKVDLDTLDMDMKFADMSLFENNNIEHLKALKTETEEEIRTLQSEGEKVNKQFMYLSQWGKKAKIHLQTLMQQEMMYDEQIRRLGKK